MKHCLKPVYVLLAAACFTAAPGYADNEKSMVISIETDSINLTDMDIGSLAVGESKTIETESGQVIDLLRTVDDVEIYIDGELLDIGFGHEPESQVHVIRKHVEITCDDENEETCAKHVVINTDGDHELSSWSSAGDAEVLIHDDIEITCFGDDDDSECTKHAVWVTKGGEIEIESLHEEHLDSAGRKIIIITSKAESKD